MTACNIHLSLPTESLFAKNKHVQIYSPMFGCNLLLDFQTDPSDELPPQSNKTANGVYDILQQYLKNIHTNISITICLTELT